MIQNLPSARNRTKKAGQQVASLSQEEQTGVVVLQEVRDLQQNPLQRPPNLQMKMRLLKKAVGQNNLF